ncbi:hypothetical protein ACQ4M3_09505 [Leptolyngbya sp. AN03gr2]|uniref:hypothetical protein n=1 Tax=Leptolyngbya sp. AN03gr2 TaxID=3423364 RepID=UPI003D314472
MNAQSDLEYEPLRFEDLFLARCKLTRLTPTETYISRQIIRNQTNAEIAKGMYRTVGTVKTHVRLILNKVSQADTSVLTRGDIARYLYWQPLEDQLVKREEAVCV